MLIVAKLFMNNFFFKVLIFLSEYPFRLVRFEISTRTENRTVLSRNIGTKRNGDFFLWIWDRILNFKIPNIWNGSGYLQIPDPPVPCTPLDTWKKKDLLQKKNLFHWRVNQPYSSKSISSILVKKEEDMPSFLFLGKIKSRETTK